MKTKTHINNLATCIILLVALMISFISYPQIAITADGTAPDPTAILDVKSTEKGVLVPRLSKAEIEAMVNPAHGLLVFCTHDNRFYFYDENLQVFNEIAIGEGTITPTLTWTCGEDFIDDRDDQVYSTYFISGKCWMKENLNYLSEGVWYDEDLNNGIIYGRLYSSGSANNVCPAGWHLPLTSEWQALIDDWGGETEAGGAMKEVGFVHWLEPNTGATNSSEFTGFPGGFGGWHGDNYLFWDINEKGIWWGIGTGSKPTLSSVTLNYDDESAILGGIPLTPSGGDPMLSIRCIKDE